MRNACELCCIERNPGASLRSMQRCHLVRSLASTYSAPQFTSQFGSFSSLLRRYGGPDILKEDLEAVKGHLYVPMAA